MARAAVLHILLGVAATGLLAGCVDGTGSGAGGGTAGLSATPARGGAAQDVEAPEIFQTTDSALWDGRPSLGGIWVASPEAVDPERVVMFNPATGKTVTGALFRRERDNPGPTLQISSDAAEALGILAGQPTQIRVTALRRVEPEAPAVVAEPPAADPAAETASETVSETATGTGAPAATDAAAIAAAALDATGTAVAATAEGAAEATGEATAEGAAAATEAATEPPKRKTWKERRAEAKAKREAEKAAREAAKAAEEAAAASAEGADLAEAPTADSIGTGEIETAPLDARAPEAVAATPAAAEPAAVASPPQGAGRPIQIASFSKEENAARAVEALAKIGITAQPQKSERNGAAVWGVVAFGDQALLARIKEAGFADAYFLQ